MDPASVAWQAARDAALNWDVLDDGLIASALADAGGEAGALVVDGVLYHLN